MVDDQRFAARRPDVLVYQTEPLEAEITLAGPVMPDLKVSTTGTDSDWVVKLIDVYPDDYPDPDPNPTALKMGGYQQLVRGDVMRGKFRDSFESPEPFEPGKPTTVRMKMNDVYHTFRPGTGSWSRSSPRWFPLVDRNPQTFVDIYQAKPADFRKATQRVYRSRALLEGRRPGRALNDRFRLTGWRPKHEARHPCRRTRVQPHSSPTTDLPMLSVEPDSPDRDERDHPERRRGRAEDGPLVILLHGFPEFWYGWRHQIGPLARPVIASWPPTSGGTTRATSLRGSLPMRSTPWSTMWSG